ncbi:MAG: hypothetical protein ACPG43_03680, partial [Alcanivoracaceae bacterium]
DLKSKTTAGSDRALSERAEDRRRDVDGVEAVELPAPNPEADGDSASDSADADAAEDAGDASASDEETSDG